MIQLIQALEVRWAGLAEPESLDYAKETWQKALEGETHRIFKWSSPGD